MNDHKPSWGGDNHWKRFSWSGKSDWKPSRRRTLNDRTDRSFRNSDKSKDGPNSSKERSMSDWMPGWMPGWMPEWKPTYNYCGSSLDDANSRCGVSCYDGADASCPTGEQCYTNAKKCPLVKPDGWSGGVNHVNVSASFFHNKLQLQTISPTCVIYACYALIPINHIYCNSIQ